MRWQGKRWDGVQYKFVVVVAVVVMTRGAMR